MKKTHYKMSSADETQQVHIISWQGDQEPLGVLQIVHGMQEYIDRYDALARYLVECGWTVIGHDHLGHGQSGIHERGHFSDHPEADQVLMEDIHQVTLQAKRLWPGVQVFVLGHSMGSFMTRLYAAQYSQELGGAIIMGSGWYNVVETGICHAAANLVCALHGPHHVSGWLTALCSLPFLFAYRNEGKNAWLSVNPENAATMDNDPLRAFPFTAGSYKHMYKLLKDVSKHKHFGNLRRNMPLLIISGEKDPVGGKSAVEQIAEDLRQKGFQQVTQRVVPGDRHEILFEADGEHNMGYLYQWLRGKVLDR